MKRFHFGTLMPLWVGASIPLLTLPLLPLHIGQLFCQALRQGTETDWVRSAILTRRLKAPAGAPDNWP